MKPSRSIRHVFRALLLLVLLGGALPALAGPAPESSVLIDSASLHGWIERGLVNREGKGRVVLLDVTDPGSYAAGHIPGAQLWDVAEQVQTRLEGPAPAVNMVLDGPRMDAMLQKHGIDRGTTVVITSSKTETYFPARAYFLLRYWGFPKSQIKVLDGFNGAWDRARLTSEVPTILPSSLSVRDLRGLRDDERVSLGEMILAVRRGCALPLDMRGDLTAPGSTPGVFPDVAGDFVVFEGRPAGGKAFSWKNFNVDYAGGDLRFKGAGEIETALAAVGVNGSRPVMSYCRTGYIGSVGYMVLDGILGWEVATYDGSWSQWGKLSDRAEAGGELPPGSLWATDRFDLSEVINYNAEAGLTVESLRFDPAAHALHPDPADPRANVIEIEDACYQRGGRGC